MSYYQQCADRVATTVLRMSMHRFSFESRRMVVANLKALAYQELLTDCGDRVFVVRLDAATERAAEWLDANAHDFGTRP